MATIKIDDSIKNSIDKFNSSVNNYKDSVASSMAAVQQCSEVLKGKSYTKLFASIQEKVDEQLNLVAECLVLKEMINEYLKTMTEKEISAPFPS